MSKKRFNKKEGFRFTLLHRSQQDPLYHDEENGSKFILHPADRKTAEAMEVGLLSHEGSANYVTSESAAKSKQELAKKREKTFGQIKEYREVDDYGLPLDGYDYSKHLSSLGGGAFISSDGNVISQALPMVEKQPLEEDVLQLLPESVFASQTEQPRLLEAITLRPEGMDEDMKRQLGLVSDDDEEAGEEDDDSAATGEWGDLQDDFMTQIVSGGLANKETEEDDGDKNITAEGGDDAFDFDAHMARLMKEAEEEDAEDEDDEDDLSEYDLSSRKKITTTEAPERTQRDVDEHFAAVLAVEYENDEEDNDEFEEEDGDIDEQYQEGDEEFDVQVEYEEEELELQDEGEDTYADIYEEERRRMEEIKKLEELSQAQSQRKRSDLESRSTMTRKSKKAAPKLIEQDDPVFLQAINEFLQQKESDTSLGQVAQPPPAAETLRLVQASHPEKIAEGFDEVEDGEAEFEDEEEEPPTYEEMMKMWGTYSVTQKPQFDCATIVSTLSTTDNIPSEIVIENFKKKKQTKPKENAVLPATVEEMTADDETATVESVARDIARMALEGLAQRSRDETAEERKARKALVKEMKKDRRTQKKKTKEEFKRERAQLLHAMTAPGAPKPGVSEFKIG